MAEALDTPSQYDAGERLSQHSKVPEEHGSRSVLRQAGSPCANTMDGTPTDASVTLDQLPDTYEGSSLDPFDILQSYPPNENLIPSSFGYRHKGPARFHSRYDSPEPDQFHREPNDFSWFSVSSDNKNEARWGQDYMADRNISNGTLKDTEEQLDLGM